MEMLRCQNRQRFGAGESRVLHPGFCQLEGPRFVSGRVRALAEGLEVARCRSEIRGGEGLSGAERFAFGCPGSRGFRDPGGQTMHHSVMCSESRQRAPVACNLSACLGAWSAGTADKICTSSLSVAITGSGCLGVCGAATCSSEFWSRYDSLMAG